MLGHGDFKVIPCQRELLGARVGVQCKPSPRHTHSRTPPLPLASALPLPPLPLRPLPLHLPSLPPLPYHFNLQPSNVMLEDANGAITFIDFELAGPNYRGVSKRKRHHLIFSVALITIPPPRRYTLPPPSLSPPNPRFPPYVLSHHPTTPPSSLSQLLPLSHHHSHRPLRPITLPPLSSTYSSFSEEGRLQTVSRHR